MARTYGTRAMPGSPSELADLFADPAAAAEKMGGSPAEWRQFQDEYAQRLMASGDLPTQIREQTQVVLAEFLKSNGMTGPAAAMALAPAGRSAIRAAAYNADAPGARVDREWSGAAELCHAVNAHARGHAGAAAAGKLARVTEIQNSFGSEIPASGGFLVPETMRSDILQMSLESAIIRRRAQVIPMNTLRVPVPMIDDTSHASSVLGGVTFYWTEESAAITESQASFGVVTLDAKKLSGYFAVPNELLDDAPAFGAFFDRVIPAGHAWFEDLAFMTGSGVGQPLGFVNCPASVQVAAEVGQPTKTLVWENITKMYARMLPASLGKAIWIANIDTFPQLATMALSVGTGGGPVWIGGYPGAGGGTTGADTPPVTILGRPVFFTEKLPALGTTGDICFVDPAFYLLGDRQVLQLSMSEHFLFQNDKTAFRLLNRVDGRPWLQSALTPATDSTNTLTAFVQLANR
jgi:HK97 family phage major capsid protein